MRKLGRPTDNPRVLRVAVRLNEDEMNTLKKCAADLNITMTAAILNFPPLNAYAFEAGDS